jgi:hypothetical protein
MSVRWQRAAAGETWNRYRACPGAARLDERPDDVVRARRGDEQPFWDLERHGSRTDGKWPSSSSSGASVSSRRIVADGAIREVSFPLSVERSSWWRLILPSSHQSIFIVVNDRPVQRRPKR